MLKLYTYFRSSAAYRVRCALNLKGMNWEAVPVHLVRDGGEQNQPAYRARSPLGTVPALETEAGVITQSLAIIEYLDETQPQPPLLPASAEGRARVRAHRPDHRLRHPPGQQPARAAIPRPVFRRHARSRRMPGTGTGSTKASPPSRSCSPATRRTGTFCHGEMPTMADCCLVPQVFNARRFNCPLDALPTIRRIVDACEQLPAFQNAAPARQPDAE